MVVILMASLVTTASADELAVVGNDNEKDELREQIRMMRAEIATLNDQLKRTSVVSFAALEELNFVPIVPTGQPRQEPLAFALAVQSYSPNGTPRVRGGAF